MEQVKKIQLRVEWYDGKTEKFDLQYNPTEISLDKSSQLAEINIPGLDSPIQQYVRGQTERLSLELFFDTTSHGMAGQVTSVTTETDKIYQLVKIEPERHAPPICTLIWNSEFPGNKLNNRMASQQRNSFRCIVDSVQQKFTLFSPDGVPLRATLSVTFREYRPLDQQLVELKLSSPNRTHAHVLQHGENLSTIAARYYRQPGTWRSIAALEENGIEDPRRLIVGKMLRVPPIT